MNHLALTRKKRKKRKMITKTVIVLGVIFIAVALYAAKLVSSAFPTSIKDVHPGEDEKRPRGGAIGEG
jgi:uncharacterized membrane protein YvbJ